MRLIDADALTSRLKIIFCKECKETFGCVCCSIGDYFEEIKDAPTIEAEPVRRGRWVKVDGYITPCGDPAWKCSECGRGLHAYGVDHGLYGSSVADNQWVACPNCGAKMDEVTL